MGIFDWLFRKKENPSEPKKDCCSKEEMNETKKETTSDSKKPVKNDNGFNRILNSDGGYTELNKKNNVLIGELKRFNQKGIEILYLENIIQENGKNLLDDDGNILIDGKDIKRYNNGSLRSECCFIKGLRDGFGISYTEDGWIDQIDYYKNDEDVSWDSDENKKIMLREIKKYMNDGVNVYPVQYLGLCESLGFDPNEFKDNPNFKI